MSKQTTQKLYLNCLDIFSALGDPLRQQILLQLSVREGKNVNDITREMAISRPAVSHHLKILLQAGLVTSEGNGRQNLYRLSPHDSLAKIEQLITAIKQTLEEDSKR